MDLNNLKRFKIITFGCRTNQAESRIIAEQLTKKLKLQMVEEKESKKPDLVIINSCCVTQKAEKEVRQAIRRVKRENPQSFLVVCGCWVDLLKLKKINFQNKNLENQIDLLICNKNKNKIVQAIKEMVKIKKNKTSSEDLREIWEKTEKKKRQIKKYRKAMVKIQEGCDNFCSYCIVPYVRGRSKSRQVEEIIKDINNLLKEGIEEIVLTATDMASFKLETKKRKWEKIMEKMKISKYKNTFAGLLKLILKKSKIKKISYGSINLQCFNKEFADLFKNKDKKRLSAHFHIPLQSGCNQTLKRMRRNYKIADFLRVIRNLKKEIPEFTFSTDLIVGFPGETEREFEQTLKTLKKLKTILKNNFKKIHLFRYSERQGTLAFKMKKVWLPVKEEEKRKRLKLIEKLF